MKRKVAAICMILLASVTISAQEKRLNSAPKSFQTFFASFKRAVSHGQKTAVADMTQFPFKYGFDAGDEGVMSRRQFLNKFSHVFGKDPSQFFTERNPLFAREVDGGFSILTRDASSLSFVRSGKTYKFTGYFVEP